MVRFGAVLCAALFVGVAEVAADQAPVVVGGSGYSSESSVNTRAAPSGVTYRCEGVTRSRLGAGDTLKRSDTRSIRQVVGARCGSSRSVNTRGFTAGVPNRLYVVSLSPTIPYSGAQLTLWKADGTYVNGPAVARPGFPNDRWTADFGCFGARRMFQRFGGNLVMQVVRRNNVVECYNVCSTSVTIRNGRVQAADARTRESGESGALPAECRASRRS